MFDIGWQELFIVAILGLIVVGPKDLPRALRTIMGLIRKGRMMARDFQSGIDEVVREADLLDMKNQVEGLADGDLTKKIEETFDPNGDIASDLDMTEIQDDLGKIAKDNGENPFARNEIGEDGVERVTVSDPFAEEDLGVGSEPDMPSEEPDKPTEPEKA